MSNKVEIDLHIIGRQERGAEPAYLIAVPSKTFTDFDGESVVGGEFDGGNLEWFRKVEVADNGDGTFTAQPFEETEEFDNRLSATYSDAEDLGVTYSFLLTDSDFNIIKTLYENIRISDALTVTTLSELDRLRRAPRFPRLASYFTREEWYRWRDALINMATDATTLVKGAVRIDTVMANPIVVTTTSALLTAATTIKLGRVYMSKAGSAIAIAANEIFYLVAKRQKYIEDYAGSTFVDKYNALIADVGTVNRYKLVISDQHQISGVTFVQDANIQFDFQHPGMLTLDDGADVTLTNFKPPGRVKVFHSETGCSLKYAATCPSVWQAEWVAGVPEEGESVNIDQLIRTVMSSAEESHGGILEFGVGEFVSTIPFGHKNGLIIKGAGSNPYGNFVTLDPNGGNGGGTNLIYTGVDEYFFYAGDLEGGADNQRQMILKDLNIDCRNTNATNFLVEGTQQNIYGIRFQDVVFLGGSRYCFDINVVIAAQVEMVLFDHCYFIGAAMGQVRINTNNGSNHFAQCYFFTMPNTDCVILNKMGATTFVNCVPVGANTPGATTFTADASTDILTTPFDSYGTGTEGWVTTSGSLPGGLAADTHYWVIRTGAGTIKFATSLANAQAGTAINITSAGTGTHTFQPAPLEGRSFIAIRALTTEEATAGDNVVDVTNLVVMGCQDEALNYSLYDESFELLNPSVFKGNLFQGNMLIRGVHTIVSEGNTYWGRAFRDTPHWITDTRHPEYARHPFVFVPANEKTFTAANVNPTNNTISDQSLLDNVIVLAAVLTAVISCTSPPLPIAETVPAPVVVKSMVVPAFAFPRVVATFKLCESPGVAIT